MESKHSLRNQYRRLRSQKSDQEVIETSKTICTFIRQMPEYLHAKTIAIYYPINKEIQLLALMSDLDKRFCFPKIIHFADASMDFFEAGNEFKDSIFGMKEPTGRYVERDEIDLFLVPGLAFSKQGYRLGYGKGFYDHYLKGIDKPKIGVAFDFQILDEIPFHDEDQKMTSLVSEKGTSCIQPS